MCQNSTDALTIWIFILFIVRHVFSYCTTSMTGSRLYVITKSVVANVLQLKCIG